MGNNNYRRRKKIECALQVFDHYTGGKVPAYCAKCDKEIFRDEPFCVIATTAEAKALRHEFHNRVGATFYPIIVRENFPDGFEIRCDACMHGPDFQQISSKGMTPQPLVVD